MIETASCPSDVDVVRYAVTNGGHTWPGGHARLPEVLVGPVGRQFDAAETIWQFFAAH
ncbi:hypothetical protein [Nocardia bhagyanarayanae]|uniref:hypothetical protein n=1 Tax=Nocardia bhagyanarayanae TaxID=1215925 RepID=UPI00163B3C8F|nr:hypothetical protein [Nocardia bhagyanarayanae]